MSYNRRARVRSYSDFFEPAQDSPRKESSMAEVETNKEKPKFELSAFGLIEKASEFKWGVQLGTFALFIDTALVLFKHKNFLSLEWGKLSWVSEIGEIAVAFIMFCVLMSAALPLLEILVVGAVLFLESLLSPFLSKNERRYIGKGMVTVWDLERLADEEKCNYLLAKCKAANEAAEKAKEDSTRMASIVFKFLVMLGLNIFIGQQAAPSTIQFILQNIEYKNYTGGIALTYLILGWFCTKIWTAEPTQVRVYFLPLYEKQEAEKAALEKKYKAYDMRPPSSMRFPRH